MTVRYQAPTSGVTMQLLVNGRRYPFTFRKTGEVWTEVAKDVELEEGENAVILKFATTASPVFVDCIKIDRTDAQVYNFEDDEAATTATDPAATMLTVKDGEAGVVAIESDGTKNHALHAYTAGLAGMGQAILDMFPRDATDYTVSWKQIDGDAGILMRGGYLFKTDGLKVSVSTTETKEDGGLAIVNTLGEGDRAEGMDWLRATLQGDKLYLDGSTDGVVWENLLALEDATFTVGGTRLCWDAVMTVDDITLYRSGMTVSQTDLEEISQTNGGTNRVVGSFDIGGDDLLDDVQVELEGEAFEISVDSLDGYTQTLVIDRATLADGTVRIYVRLKPEMKIGDYEGVVSVITRYLDTRKVNLKGTVNPATYTTYYDFEEDAVTNGPTNPPASGVTRGTGNLCTAGVADYTDADVRKSQMLRIYGAPGINSTGVLNLDKFTRKSTDYSVTWRQVVTSAGSYKNGVLMRGDTLTVGSNSSGYTQGMMAGYYLNVYNDGATTQFRIYKSTASRSLNMFNSSSVALSAPVGKSIWYRASVSGTTKVTLKIEYSTDGENWNVGTVTTDEGGDFRQGATQFVWGLAASTNNFLIDDIAFEGITYDEGVVTGIMSAEESAAGVDYEEYYDVAGRRIRPGDVSKGVIIRRSHLTDGTVKVEKILKK